MRDVTIDEELTQSFHLAFSRMQPQEFLCGLEEHDLITTKEFDLPAAITLVDALEGQPSLHKLKNDSRHGADIVAENDLIGHFGEPW